MPHEGELFFKLCVDVLNSEVRSAFKTHARLFNSKAAAYFLL